MADERGIFLYLEDIAHENFIRRIIELTAQREQVTINIQVRNARGGAAKAREALIEDIQRWTEKGLPDVCEAVVVCIDSNCSKPAIVKKALIDSKRQLADRGISLILAIPEPHIEHWYLLDQSAFNTATKIQLRGAPPQRQCGRKRQSKKRSKDYYKNYISQAAAASHIRLLQNGAEFGRDIANQMDIDGCRRLDSEFNKFVEQLENLFRRWRD